MHQMSNYGILLSMLLERSEVMPNKPFRPDQFGDDRWEWFEAHLTPQLKNRLYFEALMILHNQQDAEDAVAFARLHAILKLHQLKKEESFYSWMLTILRREARHIKAKGLRNTITFCQYCNIERNMPVYSPEQQIIDRERKNQLLDAVNQLKSPEKEIVTMRNWRGMSLLEIAKELGLNYHTTRSKYTRAIHMLMDILKKEGGDNNHENL